MKNKNAPYELLVQYFPELFKPLKTFRSVPRVGCKPRNPPEFLSKEEKVEPGKLEQKIVEIREKFGSSWCGIYHIPYQPAQTVRRNYDDEDYDDEDYDFYDDNDSDSPYVIDEIQEHYLVKFKYKNPDFNKIHKEIENWKNREKEARRAGIFNKKSEDYNRVQIESAKKNYPDHYRAACRAISQNEPEILKRLLVDFLEKRIEKAKASLM